MSDMNAKSAFSGGVSDLSRVLAPERVFILPKMTKPQALKTLIESLAQTPEVKDAEALEQGIFHREELMSTGIGLGIGVPHVRLPSVKNPVMAAALCHEPIQDYDSLDGQPVRLLFMIAAGQNQHAEHIRLLSLISCRLKDNQLRAKLLALTDKDAFYHALIEGEV
jgi:PTS system nitrogen regulatory IIA component